MNQEQKDIHELIASNKELFSNLRGARVLVTGATGLVGSMVTKAIIIANNLYKYDISVVGYIRNKQKAKEIFGNLFGSIEFTLDLNVNCDYIIHTISPTASKFFVEQPVETIKSSVLSTIESLETAKANNAEMVYLSSMEQYGVPYQAGQTMTEDKIGIIDHLNVRSSYSESKRLCECLCASYAKEYGVDVKIARLAQTFGAGIPISDNRMPIQFARAVVEQKDIVLHTEGKSLSNFVYLTDAIAGILTILQKGIPGEAYNVCNDSETRSVREIAELVCCNLSNGSTSCKVELLDNTGYAPDVDMYLNSNKLINLGWQPRVDMLKAYQYLINYLEEKKAVNNYS